MKKKLAIAAAVLLAVPLAVGISMSVDGPIDLAPYDVTHDLDLLHRPPEPAPLPVVTLSVLSTGSSVNPEATAFGGGSWFKGYTSVFSAVLVRHPKGTILFETGLGTKIDEQFGTNSALYRQVFKYEKGKPVVEQLKDAAVSPAEVKRIILSHLHWDHAGGLADFPDAEVYVPRAEYEHALRASPPAFLKQQFEDPKIKWHWIEFAATPYENFDSHLDLFGDGSVVLVPLPGHTPGSLGMFVNQPSGRRYLFTGDLTWAHEGFTVPTQRPWPARLLVDFEPDAVRRSIAKVHTLMAQRPSLIVLPTHDDRAQRAALARFPAFQE